MDLERTKHLVARRKDSPPDGLPVEFPLEDSQKLLVIKDRRRKPDLRKAEDDIINTNAIPTKKTGASMRSLVSITLIVAVDIAFVLLVYTLIVAIQG